MALQEFDVLFIFFDMYCVLDNKYRKIFIKIIRNMTYYLRVKVEAIIYIFSRVQFVGQFFKFQQHGGSVAGVAIGYNAAIKRSVRS